MTRGSARIYGFLALSVLLGVSTTATALHLRPWVRAAHVRDAILTAAGNSTAMHQCHDVSIVGLPDSEAGAYVFRNGVSEAFGLAGVQVRATVRSDCKFEWLPSLGGFRRVE